MIKKVDHNKGTIFPIDKHFILSSLFQYDICLVIFGFSSFEADFISVARFDDKTIFGFSNPEINKRNSGTTFLKRKSTSTNEIIPICF